MLAMIGSSSMMSSFFIGMSWLILVQLAEVIVEKAADTVEGGAGSGEGGLGLVQFALVAEPFERAHRGDDGDHAARRAGADATVRDRAHLARGLLGDRLGELMKLFLGLLEVNLHDVAEVVHVPVGKVHEALHVHWLAVDVGHHRLVWRGAGRWYRRGGWSHGNRSRSGSGRRSRSRSRSRSWSWRRGAVVVG